MYVNCNSFIPNLHVDQISWFSFLVQGVFIFPTQPLKLAHHEHLETPQLQPTT